MILAAIEIENYKQYAGYHRIEFPQQGMVAITGPNGAGKTTLFEAIEWCLYGPKSIARDSIPPHGGVGKTIVRVTLEEPQRGCRWVVQRELRPSSTKAEIYTEDQPGQPKVQGARDVTEYVARQLIGLPHAAFVSTFFTRQKELSFFGEFTPTDRRVEVGKLLGFQIIREAQNELAAERTEARNLATSLRGQYERESRDRDFAAEIAAAEAGLAQASAEEASSLTHSTAAEERAERNRETLEQWRAKQEWDAALDRELVRVSGEMATADANRSAADDALRRLALRAEERQSLAPLAEAVDVLQFEAGLLEEQRLRAERARTLDENRQAFQDGLARIAGQLRQMVKDHERDASGLIPWAWSSGDEERPEDVAARLRQAIETLDVAQARSRVELLLRAQVCATNATDIEKNLSKMRAHFQGLSRERAALVAAGDPEAAVMAATAAEARWRDAERDARQAQTATNTGRGELERILDQLRGRPVEPICPTCARPLGQPEVNRIVAVLEADIARLRDEETLAATTVAAAVAEIAAAGIARAAAAESVRELSVLDGRLADGRRVIETEEEKLRDCVADRDGAFDAAGVAAAPLDVQVDAARTLVMRMERLSGLQRLLSELGRQAVDSRRQLSAADGQISELGPVSYDRAAHEKAQNDLAVARTASIQIVEIDKELASRDRYVQQRDAATEASAQLAALRESIVAERAAVGFDRTALDTARAEEAETRAAAHAARNALIAAREVLQQARAALQQVVAERDRLHRLADAADRAMREADELDRMVREFVEFDRYVADRVGPLLAETTERLLAQVTDGKYDRVRFDENYGIEVYDGDEAFDLTSFSGGERDVVSLCARLAMSELVGSAAMRPPRFLVLDEVFGSLDSERRAQLLGTLGSLASGGHFEQVFIISHVEDVQQSHVMDEAWTIEERDGVSQVRRPVQALAEADSRGVYLSCRSEPP
ncbi:MAG: SMC family ATPase [Thermomicrobiales bacterium]